MPSFRRTLTALAAFGIAFGLLEAAVVIDLRAISAPVRQSAGLIAGDLFPLLTLDQIERGPAGLARLVAIEILREFATLAMLAACGLLAARSFGEWLAAFAVAFGVWDIFYYVFLKLLIGWPSSLFTLDLLFLIPAPWYGPVLAPIVVSATMIVAGAAYLRHPFPVSRGQAAGVLAGVCLLLASFLWDWRNLLGGGLPNPFPWALFALGEAAAAVSLLSAWRARGDH